MARWFTVLIALVAQGTALMSPMCFVRCIGADGHECVELIGQGCNCCDCGQSQPSPPVCAVEKCGEQCHDHDQEQDAPAGFQVHCEHCSCQHLPMVSAPQTLSKSLVSDVLSPSQNAMMTQTMSSATDIRILEEGGLPPLSLRSQESLHLTVLATVVLRM